MPAGGEAPRPGTRVVVMFFLAMGRPILQTLAHQTLGIDRSPSTTLTLREATRLSGSTSICRTLSAWAASFRKNVWRGVLIEGKYFREDSYCKWRRLTV